MDTTHNQQAFIDELKNNHGLSLEEIKLVVEEMCDVPDEFAKILEEEFWDILA